MEIMPSDSDHAFTVIEVELSDMEEGSVFNSDQGQEIRLPKDVALPEHVKKVDVIALSNTRVITPAGQAWDAWFDSEGVSADFMNERDQPEQVDP